MINSGGICKCLQKNLYIIKNNHLKRIYFQTIKAHPSKNRYSNMHLRIKIFNSVECPFCSSSRHVNTNYKNCHKPHILEIWDCDHYQPCHLHKTFQNFNTQNILKFKWISVQKKTLGCWSVAASECWCGIIFKWNLNPSLTYFIRSTCHNNNTCLMPS